MSAKLSVIADKYEDGRINKLTIQRSGRKAVSLQYVYDVDGFVRNINFEGRKEDMPSVPEIVALFDAKFTERIGVIGEITKIGDIGSTSTGAVVNPDFEEGLRGWTVDSGDVEIDDTESYRGQKCVKLAHGASITQTISPPIPTDSLFPSRTVSIAYRSTVIGANKGNIKLYFTDGTTQTLQISPLGTAGFSLYTSGATVTVAKNIAAVQLNCTAGAGQSMLFDSLSLGATTFIAQTVNVDIVAQTIGLISIDIVAQSMGNLTIDIAAQTIGNLNVNLAAAAATVTITGGVTITTSGGTNIIIDKLTQAAFTMRADVNITNDNGVAAPTAPPSTFNGGTYRGKFFPRGCRGTLREFYIYCVRSAAGTLTLSFSPQPGMGAVASVTITPGAGWAWASAGYQKMWNYDSLFIWISACSADVSVGYENVVSPYIDWLKSDDSGVTWYRENLRLFVRAVFDGGTIGDVPVSGTVNNVEIPTQSQTRLYALENNVGTGAETTLKTVEGAGHSEYTLFNVAAHADSNDMVIRVYTDDVLSFEWDFLTLNTVGYTASTPGISLLKYAADGYCSVHLALKFSFRRSLKMACQAVATGAQVVTVEGLVNLMK